VQGFGRIEYTSKRRLKLKEDQWHVNGFSDRSMIAIRNFGIKRLAQERRDGKNQQRISTGRLGGPGVRHSLGSRRSCDSADHFAFAGYSLRNCFEGLSFLIRAEMWTFTGIHIDGQGNGSLLSQPLDISF
jgi:hypothetical protein